jgi:hypothetical protein
VTCGPRRTRRCHAPGDGRRGGRGTVVTCRTTSRRRGAP